MNLIPILPKIRMNTSILKNIFDIFQAYNYYTLILIEFIVIPLI